MPIGGWQVFEKQTGGKQYEKYDTIYAVIVSNSKKPSHLYLSKKSYEDLGNPEWVTFLFNGTEVGISPADETTRNAYKIAFPVEGAKRPFLNCRAMIESTKGGKRKLKQGVYMARMLEMSPNRILVFNSNDEPSTP